MKKFTMGLRIKVQFKNRLCRYLPRDIFFSKGYNGHKLVALTFDDGPHPEYTQTILKILNKSRVKATFFLAGSQVEKYPQLVEEIINERHEVGNHNFSHRRIKTMSYKELGKEIQRTNKIIQDITGLTPRIFRPPYGELSLRLLWYVFREKMILVLWSLDSQDLYDKSHQGIINRLKEVKAGDIILLHEDCPHTVEALADIIKEVREKGLDFVSVSELIERK